VANERGQLRKEPAFFIRLNNGTQAIRDEGERQRYVAQRWPSNPT
jgi:hypothetical protein